MDIETQNLYVTIAISSLTDMPIGQSDNLLLTAMGDAKNTNQSENVFDDSPGTWPVLIEVVKAEVRLTTQYSDLQVWSVDTTGNNVARLNSSYNNGILTFRIGYLNPSMYYRLVREN